MCIVSMVYDLGRTIPLGQWTLPAVNDFSEIIRRLDELDRKLGQPECHDPSKAEWFKDLQARLRALEEKK